MSRPLRACGLKPLPDSTGYRRPLVTPFAGVWIETPGMVIDRVDYIVTPFAGVWIETPARYDRPVEFQVTPFAGVWIETLHLVDSDISVPASRPLAGVWIETQMTV